MMVDFLNHSNMSHMVNTPSSRYQESANVSVAGYTACAISVLSILNRLPNSLSEADTAAPGLTNMSETIRWLVSRQIGYQNEEEDETEVKAAAPPVLAGVVYEDKFMVPGLTLQDEEFVGFNGRCNKNADTCYAYWVTASLDVRISSPGFEMIFLTTRRCLGKIKSSL